MPHPKQKKRRLLYTFGRRQRLAAGIGIGLIIMGYLCLATGSTDGVLSRTIAPLLLTPAYCVCFPLAILHRHRRTPA